MEKETWRKLWEQEYDRYKDKLWALEKSSRDGNIIIALGQGYRESGWAKPLDEMSDEEFLATPGIGPRRLRHIRQVISQKTKTT